MDDGLDMVIRLCATSRKIKKRVIQAIIVDKVEIKKGDTIAK